MNVRQFRLAVDLMFIPTNSEEERTPSERRLYGVDLPIEKRHVNLVESEFCCTACRKL